MTNNQDNILTNNNNEEYKDSMILDLKDNNNIYNEKTKAKIDTTDKKVQNMNKDTNIKNFNHCKSTFVTNPLKFDSYIKNKYNDKLNELNQINDLEYYSIDNNINYKIIKQKNLRRKLKFNPSFNNLNNIKEQYLDKSKYHIEDSIKYYSKTKNKSRIFNNIIKYIYAFILLLFFINNFFVFKKFQFYKEKISNIISNNNIYLIKSLLNLLNKVDSINILNKNILVINKKYLTLYNNFNSNSSDNILYNNNNLTKDTYISELCVSNDNSNNLPILTNYRLNNLFKSFLVNSNYCYYNSDDSYYNNTSLQQDYFSYTQMINITNKVYVYKEEDNYLMYSNDIEEVLFMYYIIFKNIYKYLNINDLSEKTSIKNKETDLNYFGSINHIILNNSLLNFSSNMDFNINNNLNNIYKFLNNTINIQDYNKESNYYQQSYLNSSSFYIKFIIKYINLILSLFMILNILELINALFNCKIRNYIIKLNLKQDNNISSKEIVSNNNITNKSSLLDFYNNNCINLNNKFDVQSNSYINIDSNLTLYIDFYILLLNMLLFIVFLLYKFILLIFSTFFTLFVLKLLNISNLFYSYSMYINDNYNIYVNVNDKVLELFKNLIFETNNNLYNNISMLSDFINKLTKNMYNNSTSYYSYSDIDIKLNSIINNNNNNKLKLLNISLYFVSINNNIKFACEYMYNLVTCSSLYNFTLVVLIVFQLYSFKNYVFKQTNLHNV